LFDTVDTMVYNSSMKRHTVRFSEEAYIALVVLAAEASVERGRPVSLNEYMNELLIEKLEQTNEEKPND
jgi:hypothetical protein